MAFEYSTDLTIIINHVRIYIGVSVDLSAGSLFFPETFEKLMTELLLNTLYHEK